ncbi:MAG TPA: SUMF1/EgtB/PvdO family nonheme iron enzyme [Planctomycetota bacterium]|nr:SUMF1/EgtB/PvdO family nonheme iron enzyme [Planctomycetota bacterium]
MRRHLFDPLTLFACSALACATACSSVAPTTPQPPTEPPNTLTLHLPDGPPIDLILIPGHGTTAPFFLARTELTHAQYAAFLRATHYDGSEHPSSKPTEPFLHDWPDRTTPPPDRADHPVCYLNVHHARAFCEWASRASGRHIRLPSDAEWELAARGPEGRTYPWGSDWDPTRCNFGSADDGFAEAAPVGSFPRGATPEGLLDMAGNIWEWTAEQHLRGGPWCMGPETVKSAFVAHEDPDRADDKFGFRIAVEP